MYIAFTRVVVCTSLPGSLDGGNAISLVFPISRKRSIFTIQSTINPVAKKRPSKVQNVKVTMGLVNNVTRRTP